MSETIRLYNPVLFTENPFGFSEYKTDDAVYDRKDEYMVERIILFNWLTLVSGWSIS